MSTKVRWTEDYLHDAPPRDEPSNGPETWYKVRDGALYWLGRALESKGDSQQAARAYAAALQLAPGMAEARARLNFLQAKSG